MSPYRIILADDHVMLRQGLKRILREKADIEVIGEAGDGLELLRLLNSLKPDMIVVDVSMPNMRGIEAICEVRSAHPAIKMLVLTMHKDREYLSQAMAAGADGYLLKDDADEELFSAIEKIRRGKIYVSPKLSDMLTGEWAEICRGKPSPGHAPLSAREREILKLIAEGKSGKEIASVLFISARTVDRHRANIMDKLGLRKTADLVKYAIQKGYV